MARCVNCNRELIEADKSWTYGVFKVDAYSCDCGAKFNVYTAIHVIMGSGSGKGRKLEKHTFTLKCEKGKWVKHERNPR